MSKFQYSFSLLAVFFFVFPALGQETEGQSFYIRKILDGDANKALNVLNEVERLLKIEVKKLCGNESSQPVDLKITIDSGTGRFCGTVNPKGALSGETIAGATAVKIGYCYPVITIEGAVDCH